MGNTTLIIPDNTQALTITITDHGGKRIWYTTASGSSIPIPSQSFANGVYDAAIITAGGVQHIKFVKQ